VTDAQVVTLAELRHALTRRLNATNLLDEIESLEPRKREELEFHDRDRQVRNDADARADRAASVPHNKQFYATTRQSVRYIDEWFRSAVGAKVFLDYGCGNGIMAIKAAKLGAALAVGIDISGVSVNNAIREAKNAGVADRCIFLQADCENTLLPANCIDVVLCSGMLHHVDLTRAFPELARIMKPGGKALAIEALGYNPLIQLYRRLTPHLRTNWESEHILSMKDVSLARQFFTVRDIRHWHLFSIGAVAAPTASRLRAAMLDFGDLLDRAALKVPGLQLMSWQFSFEFVKE
jgi:SAM-dependent methyltransferase